ncbi:MAG: ABC transporter permease [Planctomycetes bacterium]|nr:ABC transporter permease [Planctomycetota bacterium]
MMFEAPPMLLAAVDFWMSRWLTPIWFLGVGAAFGLATLALFLGLCWILSRFSFFLEGLRRSGAAHVVAGLGAIGLTGLTFWTLKDEVRLFQSDELTLVVLAVLFFFSIVTWSLLYCSSTRFLSELRSLLFEGIGLYLLSTVAVVAVVGLLCTPLVGATSEAIASIPKLFTSGSSAPQIFTIPGASEDSEARFEKLDIRYDPATLAYLKVESNKNILIGDGPSVAEFKVTGYKLTPDAPALWDRGKGANKCPLPLGPGSNVYVQNQEFGDAKLEVQVISAPPVREATTFVLVALFVTLVGLMFMLMQAAAPKASAIALSAAKSELSQPLPVILMILVALAILLFVFLPFHTFGEDIKLLKDCGITLILIVATFQAVWSASTSVSEEIDGKTALTLLSKPVHRRSFIIGKMLGVFWLVMFIFVVLGSWELLWVAYKPIYDARESSLEPPMWQQCHYEVMQTLPGLAMAFFQAVVIGAIAVALATRLPLIANFTICFAIYLLGHLTPTIVASAEGGLPLVEFFSQLISAIVPNLNLFSMEAAIDSDVTVPWTVLASVLVYTLLYFLLATVLGLLLFEDRDLA